MNIESSADFDHARLRPGESKVYELEATTTPDFLSGWVKWAKSPKQISVHKNVAVDVEYPNGTVIHFDAPRPTGLQVINTFGGPSPGTYKVTLINNGSKRLNLSGGVALGTL